MGEEPERLRADEALRKLRQSGANYLAFQGTQYGVWLSDDQCHALLAEVERLAEELKEESRLVETAWRQRDEETEKAMQAEAECERLAGRVAALETALSFYADPDNYEATPRRVRPVIEDGGGAARALFLSSALDVGGPE